MSTIKENINNKYSELIDKYNDLELDEIVQHAIEYFVGMYGRNGRSNFSKIIYGVKFNVKETSSQEESMLLVIALLMIALQKMQEDNSNEEYIGVSDNLKKEINNIEISLDTIKNIIYGINDKTITINNGINE